MNYPQYPLLSGALTSSVTGLLHNRIMTPNIQEYLSLKAKVIKTHPKAADEKLKADALSSMSKVNVKGQCQIPDSIK